jgi:DNA-binding MarR family transcriptional regulator
MNELAEKTDDRFLDFQTKKLQELVCQVVQCCQERSLYQSQRFGLPRAELGCLLLFKDRRYITAAELADLMEVSKSRVTAVVKGLLSRGLVQRDQDPHDARVQLIRLTRAGEQACQSIEDFVVELHRELLLQLHPSQRGEVLAALDLLHSSMEAVKKRLA